jgi:hypothetical protein
MWIDTGKEYTHYPVLINNQSGEVRYETMFEDGEIYTITLGPPNSEGVCSWIGVNDGNGAPVSYRSWWKNTLDELGISDIYDTLQVKTTNVDQ